MNKLKKLLLISSALLLSTANNTFATDASGSISATGSVTGTCSVTATAMAFGTLNTSGNISRTSTVTPTCTNGTTWTVTNANATQKLNLNNTIQADEENWIAFTITKTSGGDFTYANRASVYLTGLGNGSAQDQTDALTGTAGSSTGKTAGAYTGSATLTISY